MIEKGSREWNNQMFLAHPTPYNGIAGFIEKKRIQVIIQKIKTHHTGKHSRIIELGCEAGGLLTELSDAFPQAEVHGVDISDQALAEAKLNLGPRKVSLTQADICRQLPLKGPFDFIVCSETLEHIPSTGKALEQMEKIMDANSILILTVPLEKLKNRVKDILREMGLMSLLFKGIEKGFSEWHLQDFSENEFRHICTNYFDLLSYQKIWGLHQLAVLKKKGLRRKSL